jgi:integrase/recombinase XerD
MTALAITPQAGPLVLDGRAGLVAFDEAVPRFVHEKRAAATRTQYTRALGVYRAHCTERELSPFGGDAVQTYNDTQRRLWTTGALAADTVRIRLAVVKTFLTWAWEFGLTPITPALLKRWLHLPPARQLSPRDVLTADEAAALIAAARDTRDRLLIRIMLGAGLRIAEALAVRPADLWRDAGRAWLHVRPSKGEKTRDVEIDLALQADLVRWARERRLDHEARLWTLDPGTAWRMVQRTATQAGITKDITPHSLRHTHAHHLALLGVPLEVIGARLGHSDLRVTTRYTRPATLVQVQPVPALPWAAVV